MVVRFWGVRGSIPRPLLPQEVQNKIAGVVQRLKPADLASAETRERFLAGLPQWLFGTTGGNTPCVEARLADDTMILFDAGSGIQALATALQKDRKKIREFHIFFTQFHYDHVQGLPFFAPAYDPSVKVRFYSPLPELEQNLKEHMQHPYFPITMEDKMSNLDFVVLDEHPVRLGGAEITWRELNHPGRAFAYRIKENGRTFIHATDVELLESDFEKTPANTSFFQGTDVLVMDSQYTLGEAIEKYNWGHSSFSMSVDFASAWNVKNLYLFHHEPLYNDKKLHKNLQSARWYASRLGNTTLNIDLSREGEEVHV
ncbi:MAG: MBL fold metallo-hydrolase [Spirochaetaceae bacterium]